MHTEECFFKINVMSIPLCWTDGERSTRMHPASPLLRLQIKTTSSRTCGTQAVGMERRKCREESHCKNESQTMNFTILMFLMYRKIKLISSQTARPVVRASCTWEWKTEQRGTARQQRVNDHRMHHAPQLLPELAEPRLLEQNEETYSGKMS